MSLRLSDPRSRFATCIFTAMAVAVSIASPAVAGDPGSYKDAPESSRKIWGGIYGGLNAGGIFDGESRFDFLPGVAAANDTNSIELTGGFAGGHLGFNAQWNMIVLGVEGDLALGGSDNDTSCTFLGGVCTTQADKLYSVRGRLGATLTPNTLFYATGGVAFVDVAHTVDFGGQAFEDDSLVTGAVYGAGIEFMHSSRISFGIEYLRYDFEDETFDLVDLFGNVVPTDVELDSSVIRGRISLHYN